MSHNFDVSESRLSHSCKTLSFFFHFRLVRKLPAGRAFVCMDTKQLPQVLQQIFTSAMLSSR